MLGNQHPPQRPDGPDSAHSGLTGAGGRVIICYDGDGIGLDCLREERDALLACPEYAQPPGLLEGEGLFPQTGCPPPLLYYWPPADTGNEVKKAVGYKLRGIDAATTAGSQEARESSGWRND